MQPLETWCLLLVCAGRVFSEAPFFGPDDENLSHEDCGRWNAEAGFEPPWRAAIWAGGWYPCFGVLVTRNTIITTSGTAGCKIAAQYLEYWTRYSSIYAGVGSCFSIFKQRDCDANHDKIGQILRVRQALKFNLTQKHSAYAWEIDKIEHFGDFIRPICLFNRGNESDFDSKSVFLESSFLGYGSVNAAIVPKELCENSYTRKWLEEYGTDSSFLCVNSNGNYFGFSLLVNHFNGRYFLRGLGLEGHFSSQGLVEQTSFWPFLDILPHIHSIANHTSRIFVLAPTPPVKPPMRFQGGENLSFPDCGKRIAASSRGANHPWHAEIRNEGEFHGFCDGSLISKKAVLTVAQCVYDDHMDPINPAELLVSVGLHDVTLRNESGVQTLTPKEIRFHPGFSRGTGRYEQDVALLVFDQEFNLTARVQPICLWNDDSGLENVEGKLAVMAGWGFDKRDMQQQVNELQSANFVIKSYKDCYLQNIPFFGRYLKPGLNFCAEFHNGSDVCTGCTGGGLAVEREGRWFLRGMSILGKRTVNVAGYYFMQVCEPYFFTDVAGFMDWIVQTTPDFL